MVAGEPEDMQVRVEDEPEASEVNAIILGAARRKQNGWECMDSATV